MANLGEGPGGPLFCVKKKEEMTEGRKVSRASKSESATAPMQRWLPIKLLFVFKIASLTSLGITNSLQFLSQKRVSEVNLNASKRIV